MNVYIAYLLIIFKILNRLKPFIYRRGLEPVKDSELVHRILDQAIEATEVSASGEIIVVIN
ncbi:hypothetical protein GCM10017554_00320 [Acinetobacter modestus]|nr:hypothetical protein GCM10017554_00320 [Acinetobacter modestus]